MLRNRSRAVTTKQALMADHGSQPSPTQNYTKPISSFFDSPKFRPFTTNAMLSPNPILDTKPFSPFGNPFQFDRNQPKSPKILPEHKIDSKGIGLALVGAINDETIEENSSKPTNKKVLFGSKLKVQIPPMPPSALSQTESPKSPADFGIKTRKSQISAIGFLNSPKICTGCLSEKEMELSEDYTCVISHGPNPRTTRIFENCILESYYSLPEKLSSQPVGFLSFCCYCKKSLEQTTDIYIYRGERAFCSPECRIQEMLFDGVENSEFEDAHRTCS